MLQMKNEKDVIRNSDNNSNSSNNNSSSSGCCYCNNNNNNNNVNNSNHQIITHCSSSRIKQYNHHMNHHHNRKKIRNRNDNFFFLRRIHNHFYLSHNNKKKNKNSKNKSNNSMNLIRMSNNIILISLLIIMVIFFSHNNNNSHHNHNHSHHNSNHNSHSHNSYHTFSSSLSLSTSTSSSSSLLLLSKSTSSVFFNFFNALFLLFDTTQLVVDGQLIQSVDIDYPLTSWEKLSTEYDIFSERSAFASVSFKGRIYVIGGRSSSYQFWDLTYTLANADVWYTDDGGRTWKREYYLTGDYIIQGNDIKNPGYIAPWYPRFGHSVITVDTDGDDVKDHLLLIGGNTPSPNNDVWISPDGAEWNFIHYAPFAGRVFHQTTLFNGKIYLMGGSPLNNEVWEGDLYKVPGGKLVWYFGLRWHNATWDIEWKQVGGYIEDETDSSLYDAEGNLPFHNVPWSPRVGFGIATHWKPKNSISYYMHPPPPPGTDKQPQYNVTRLPLALNVEVLYIVGGYGGWKSSDPRYDGVRSRNDVFYCIAHENGTTTWHVALEEASNVFFEARAWMGLTAFSLPRDYRDAFASMRMDDEAKNHSRIWLAGGGYIGSKESKVVRRMEAYVDLYWSFDGVFWVKVHFQKGQGDYLYSTNEAFLTDVDDTPIYIGKWGMSLITHEMPDRQQWNELSDTFGQNVTAEWYPIEEDYAYKYRMYFIAGDTVDEGNLLNDVFGSSEGIGCYMHGVECLERGYCAPGLDGCMCEPQYEGAYCQRINEEYDSPANVLVYSTIHYIVPILMAFFMILMN